LNKQSRQQSTELFRLIIVVIAIAVAITIILPYLLLPFIEHDGSDPTDNARMLLSDLYNKPNVWKETRGVTFSPAAPFLSKEAVVLHTPITKEQICFSLGDFAGSEGEWEITKTKLEHKIVPSRLVRLGIICDKGKKALEADVKEVVSDAVLESCSCSEEQTCCAIVLRRVR